MNNKMPKENGFYRDKYFCQIEDRLIELDEKIIRIEDKVDELKIKITWIYAWSFGVGSAASFLINFLWK